MVENYRRETPPADLEHEVQMLAEAFNSNFDFDDDSISAEAYTAAYWEYVKAHGSPRLLEYLEDYPESDEE